MRLFTVPKPFTGKIADIQRNAIQSWLQFKPQPQIVLLGDEAGIAVAAADLGVAHLPRVARNEYGTPLLADVLKQGSAGAPDDGVCGYINTDIILTSVFPEAVARAASAFRRFLMIGERTDMAVEGRLSFSDNWEAPFMRDVQARGRPHGVTGIDYFIFRGALWENLPPFALGRTAWDNWLVFRVRSLQVPVINATAAVRAIHQDHDYAHVAYDAQGAWKGEEAKRNQLLAGDGIFDVRDATHQMRIGTVDGRRRALTLSLVRDPERLERRWDRQRLLEGGTGGAMTIRRRLLYALRWRRHLLGGRLWRRLAPYLLK